MKIKINKEKLVKDILMPIGRLCEDCVINVTKDKIYSIASLDCSSLIIYAEQKTDNEVDGSVRLNIKPINKLTSILNCIPNEDAEILIESNCIKYNSPSMKFKFIMLEDHAIQVPKIKLEKITNMEYQTSASIDVEQFLSILKTSNAVDNDKVYIYFYTRNSGDEIGLYCDVTNKKSTANSITIKLCDTYDGNPITNELVCDVDVIQKMAITKRDNIQIYFNSTIGYTGFDIFKENGLIRYIIPTMA